ncbi:bifunctional DNA primase/polymerase [Fructobacillus fructosus]|uniref:bifunctional DNA primase/polymerase n=1 Tax=Fructobacillus fructosus TaxID=1631 RepID=UPI001658A0C8|nr:bifunctional DNA primase/polymerase [Fructobacillus fructosus]MBC9119412.1 bifunctional DNA primase/polymerase [Fructobacillus fructosus]MBD9366933.1 bifunctional DNA primase/polymerase [Leuconostoc mesenteroides]
MKNDTKKALEQKFGDRVQETNNNLILTSHELITQGLPVYLMQPNSSIPYKGSRGHLDAVADEAQLIKLFSEERTNSNIGINLNDTGIVALDIDRHASDGFKSLTNAGYSLNLDEEVWEMTPKSGAHVFFKVPNGLNIKNLKHNLLNGVELLKDHVTMAPSSRIIDGQKFFYKHFNGKITDCSVMPNWLIDLASNITKNGNVAKKRVPKYSIQERWQMVLNGFTEGERNNQAVSLAGYLLKINVKANVAYEIIQKINNESALPLAENEINTIFRSVYNAEKRRRLGGRL